ncbi:MAG: metallophosphoesterase [Oscillospiraceae bacterium]|nr:metallophosphoesterase [Oscillospiraceae bacterium]
MKLLVFSDSHGDVSHMEQAVLAEAPDRIVHLGDMVRDAQRLAKRFPDLPLDYVYGNCDGCYSGPGTEQVLTVENFRILMMHGHTRGVKGGLERAVLAAQEAEAHAVLFGHTHRPLCDRAGALWVLNPGSCRGPLFWTYGILTIQEGQLRCRTVRGDAV